MIPQRHINAAALVLLIVLLLAVAQLLVGCVRREARIGSPHFTYAPEIQIEGNTTPAAAAAFAEGLSGGLKHVTMSALMYDSDTVTSMGKTWGIDALTDPTLAASQHGDAAANRTGDSNRQPPTTQPMVIYMTPPAATPAPAPTTTPTGGEAE